MLNTYCKPVAKDGAWLDLALYNGWFRMAQLFFTNQYICFDAVMYRTVWLRNKIKSYKSGKTISNLHKRNQRFRYDCKPLQLLDAHHNLYTKYKNFMPFDMSISLQSLLFDFAQTDCFNTYQIEIYDNEKLIGCSFFDVGNNSAEGISSIYDPDYTKHSIGKYLIYLQIEYCKKNNIEYFYPGYFVPYYPAFDYKLGIANDCLEYYCNTSKSWKSIQDYCTETIPIAMKALVE